MKAGSVSAGASLIVVSLLALQSCSKAPPPSSAAAPEVSVMSPVLSIKELMENIVDPMADWVFDAAVIDVSAKGVVQTTPLTDEEWLKVERGAMILAESSNLLKIPRPMVPSGDERLKAEKGGPELTPAEIEGKITRNPALWNAQANRLRDAALESLKIIKARNADGLFDAGGKIDKACESCHLEYWYPGDKKAVLENQQKTVTYDTPAR